MHQHPRELCLARNDIKTMRSNRICQLSLPLGRPSLIHLSRLSDAIYVPEAPSASPGYTIVNGRSCLSPSLARRITLLSDFERPLRGLTFDRDDCRDSERWDPPECMPNPDEAETIREFGPRTGLERERWVVVGAVRREGESSVSRSVSW